MTTIAILAPILALLIGSVSGLKFATLAHPENATRFQMDQNFQGSASVSFLETACMSILLKRDTALAINCGTIPHVFVLTTRIVNNVSIDGETYRTLNSGQPTDLHQDGLMIYKFGPLHTNSNAAPAILPPTGSSPPAPGSKCVSYTYTTEPSGNVFVSYSPVTIANPKACRGNSEFFCIQIRNQSETNAFVPVLVYCPRETWKHHSYDGQYSSYSEDWWYAGGLQRVVGSGTGSVTTYRMYYITNLVNVENL